MNVSPQAVYNYLRTIPKGNVVTYGQIAEYLGNKHFARVVGNILHANPDGDANPCYKVVNASGKLAEHYAFGGIMAQQCRLEEEGIPVINGKVDLNKYQYRENKENT